MELGAASKRRGATPSASEKLMVKKNPAKYASASAVSATASTRLPAPPTAADEEVDLAFGEDEDTESEGSVSNADAMLDASGKADGGSDGGPRESGGTKYASRPAFMGAKTDHGQQFQDILREEMRLSGFDLPNFTKEDNSGKASPVGLFSSTTDTEILKVIQLAMVEAITASQLFVRRQGSEMYDEVKTDAAVQALVSALPRMVRMPGWPAQALPGAACEGSTMARHIRAQALQEELRKQDLPQRGRSPVRRMDAQRPANLNIGSAFATEVAKGARTAGAMIPAPPPPRSDGVEDAQRRPSSPARRLEAQRPPNLQSQTWVTSTARGKVSQEAMQDGAMPKRPVSPTRPSEERATSPRPGSPGGRSAQRPKPLTALVASRMKGQSSRTHHDDAEDCLSQASWSSADSSAHPCTPRDQSPAPPGVRPLDQDQDQDQDRNQGRAAGGGGGASSSSGGPAAAAPTPPEAQAGLRSASSDTQLSVRKAGRPPHAGSIAQALRRARSLA